LAAQREIAHQRGHTITRGRAFPGFGSLLWWRSVYEADQKLWADGVDLASLGSAVLDEGTSVPVIALDDLPQTMRSNPRIAEVFTKLWDFADGYTAAMPGTPMNDTQPLFIGDMRYSGQIDGFLPLWGIIIDPTNRSQPVRWSGWMTSTAEAVNGKDPSM
jgi:hypothetical protein